jgi:hypothetical protein
LIQWKCHDSIVDDITCIVIYFWNRKFIIFIFEITSKLILLIYFNLSDFNLLESIIY